MGNVDVTANIPHVNIDDLIDDDIKEAWEYADGEARYGFMTVQSLRNQKRIIELLERMS